MGVWVLGAVEDEAEAEAELAPAAKLVVLNVFVAVAESLDPDE